MWDGLLMLLVLGGVMALASFIAGSLPLSFSMSQRQMRLISVIGTGLLVGTALIVIIPEGIETLYSAEVVPQSPAVPLRGATAAISLHNPNPEDRYTAAKDAAENAEPPPTIRIRNEYSAKSLDSLYPASLHHVRADPEFYDHKGQTSSHAWIGISLVTGFILMYLIDALPPLPMSPKPQHIPLTVLNGDTPNTLVTPTARTHSHSTTIGLVIHAFADGIALGASTATPSTQNTLGLIVFVAILVHKAPAAFGLTAVLLKQGVSKRAARGHLVLFSLAAPLGALITWTFVNLLGKSRLTTSSEDASSGTWWTGIVLIFSGGTFLYVAMHAMQSVTVPQYSHPPSSREDEEYDVTYHAPQPDKKRGLEVTLMVIGMLLPLLTQIGHVHAHGG